jgi:hypothetical protein
MSTSQYIVGNNDVWMVHFKEDGQYKSSNEAIPFAIALRKSLGCGESAPTYVCSMVMAACDATGATIERPSPEPEYLRLLGGPDSTTRPVGRFALLK